MNQKIKKLWPYLVKLHKEFPEVFESEERLFATVSTAWKDLKDKKKCPNCGAPVHAQRYSAGPGVALLLLKMAKEVRHRTNKGIPFTEANKVHIDSLDIATPIKKKQSVAKYLNLIQQPPKWRKSGYWLITNWGWKALRGEPIPKYVTVFRGKVEERSEETITLQEMLNQHKENVERAIALRKAVETDYRADVREYDAPQWAEYLEANTILGL